MKSARLNDTLWALTALANSLGETMLRILGTLAAVVLFTTVAVSYTHLTLPTTPYV